MNLFSGTSITSVDFIFTGYNCVRFFTSENVRDVEKVSAKVGRAENQERLGFLKSLVLNEDASEAFKTKWNEFVEGQTSYFYKIHPTSYIEGKPLKGWETRQIGGFNVLCPQKLVFAEWRKHDGMEAIYGKLLEKLVTENGATTFVVVPSNQLLMLKDYINHPKRYTLCPFVKGELIAFEPCDYAWYMAGVQPPALEEFLED